MKFNKNQVRVTEYHRWTDQILTVDMDSTRSNGQHLFMSVDDDNDGNDDTGCSKILQGVPKKNTGCPKENTGCPKENIGCPKKRY